MKFRTTPAFDDDYRRLKAEHKETFLRVVRDAFAPACDAWASAAAAGAHLVWPRALRVSRMRGHPRVWEMTWSFSSPDGRATFEFVNDGGEWYCLWRRVGDHGVYKDP